MSLRTKRMLNFGLTEPQNRMKIKKQFLLNQLNERSELDWCLGRVRLLLNKTGLRIQLILDQKVLNQTRLWLTY